MATAWALYYLMIPEGPAMTMIAILGRGDRSVIEVKHLREEDVGPARLEIRLHGRGEVATLAPVDAREVGLPETYDELLSRRSTPEFQVPAATLWRPRGQAHREAPRGAPLWISLDAPRRMTALVPWERLLAPLRTGPVLRAPPQLPLVPVAPTGAYRVAFCTRTWTDGQSA